MSRLIRELKAEHLTIIATLAKVSEYGINTPEGKECLSSARGVLLAHLQKEDERLYPPLQKIAVTDRSLRGTLRIMAKDTEEITAEAVRFFDKYANGGAGVAFAKDYGTLVSRLRLRVRREENTLFAKYAELVDGAPAFPMERTREEVVLLSR
ncbi:MAG: hemerythrin domain-containing protein [Chloroflexi bacterium]|nr:hemerythrin domain-containing protein [Chloroflexota bacterium]